MYISIVKLYAATDYCLVLLFINVIKTLTVLVTSFCIWFVYMTSTYNSRIQSVLVVGYGEQNSDEKCLVGYRELGVWVC